MRPWFGVESGHIAALTADIVDGLKRFPVVDLDERAAVDLRKRVDRAIHCIQRGRAPRPAVDWQAPNGPAWAQGSAGQLLQVMMNRIQNAVDACAAPPQGRREIVLQAVPGPAWQSRCDDNGPGTPAARRREVFDLLFTTQPVGQGTGLELGLSISHGIIERCGGRLSVAESAAGGACF